MKKTSRSPNKPKYEGSRGRRPVAGKKASRNQLAGKGSTITQPEKLNKFFRENTQSLKNKLR